MSLRALSPHAHRILVFAEARDDPTGMAAGVVVIDKGAGASFDSTTLSHKVVAIPFGQNGLMAGLALQGSKITTYNPSV